MTIVPGWANSTVASGAAKTVELRAALSKVKLAMYRRFMVGSPSNF
jgi:hypothetical protein